MKQIVLATNNHHKATELESFLKVLSIEVIMLRNFPTIPPLVEDGHSLLANALKKARTVFQFTQLPALADDSGLEVFYLCGQPGVYSARYAGEPRSDERNNSKLLAGLTGVPPRRRKGQFRAVLALVGSGFEDVAEGICPGVIAESPRGTNGFGYDPIFLPEGFDRTYAELTQSEKNTMSHRSRAFEKLKPILVNRIP